MLHEVDAERPILRLRECPFERHEADGHRIEEAVAVHAIDLVAERVQFWRCEFRTRPQLLVFRPHRGRPRDRQRVGIVSPKHDRILAEAVELPSIDRDRIADAIDAGGRDDEFERARIVDGLLNLDRQQVADQARL